MIKGERIQLIPLNDECFSLTLNWINDPDLRYFTGSRFPVSKKEHEQWFHQKATDKFNKTYALQIIDSDKIIGLIGNTNFDYFHRLSELFIYIGDKGEKHKGYAKEALDIFCVFCFSEMNLNKLISFIYNYNSASKKLFLSCGFHEEGCLVKHWFKNGEYNDVLIMGKHNKLL